MFWAIFYFIFLFFIRSIFVIESQTKPGEGTQKALNARLFCYNLRRLLEIVCKLFSQLAGTNDRRFGSRAPIDELRFWGLLWC